MPKLPDDSSTGAAPSGPELPTTNKSGAILPELAPESRTTSFREKVFEFVTGRRGATGASTGDARAQLIAAYGPSPRDPTRPNTAAAAKGLRVSQRTVQRWVAGGGMRPGHAKSLQTRARQAMTTKRGRAQAIRAARAARTNARPPGKNAVRVGGVQGVQSSIDENYRDRYTSVQATDADLETMQDLWVQHGEDGVAAWLHAHYDQHYTGDWHFQDIDEIGWGNSSNYRTD